MKNALMRGTTLFVFSAIFIAEMVTLGTFWVVAMLATILRSPLGGAALLTLLILLWWR